MTTKSNFNDLEMLHNMEQFETMLTNLAVALGSYYKRLMEEGIPQELAYMLVVACHQAMFNKKGGDSNG